MSIFPEYFYCSAKAVPIVLLKKFTKLIKPIKLKMKVILIFMLLVSSIIVVAAFETGSAQMSPNLSSEKEIGISSYTENMPEQLSELENRHKQLMEAGNETEAGKVKKEIDKLIPEDRKSVTMESADFLPVSREPESQGSDWATVNPTVHEGNLKSHSGYFKNIDMKIGEDGNLYLAAIRQQSGFASGIVTYKSTNRGVSWLYVYGVNYPSSYIGNISLLVESRSNSYRDSTRLIIFHNLSSSQFMDNASINFLSVRANGTAVKSGTIANPSSGNEFSNLCAVSDGAFYQSATYFGVVFMESTNNLQSKVNMRYFRTVDWGTTWTNAIIQTNYNDFCPSADYKDGSSDSIYIAVERRFDATNSQIRIVATPFSPAASFYTYFITSDNERVYKNPCLAIKQNNPVDSMIVTCTRDYRALMHYSTNGGINWVTDITLGNFSGYNTSFTYCSSTPTGTEPFTAIWLSSDGDSLSSTRGSTGNIGTSIKYKINAQDCFPHTSPVCATISTLNGSQGIAAYAGSIAGITPYNVYSNQEGIKIFHTKLLLEGFYDPQTNQMRRGDTVTAILRSPASPHTAYDTARGFVDPVDFGCSFIFTRVKSGSSYIDIRHRNSIQTWTTSNPFVAFTNSDSVSFNFTLSYSSAYGYNQVKVDNSPARFAFFTGDVNQDGTVDASDLSEIDNDSYYFASGYVDSDLNGDDFTDASDFAIADNNATKFISKVTP